MQSATLLSIVNSMTCSVCIGLGVTYIVFHLLAATPSCVSASNAYAVYSEFRKKDAVTLTIAFHVVLSRAWVVFETRRLLEYEVRRGTLSGRLYKAWACLDRNNWLIASMVMAIVLDLLNALLLYGRDGTCDTENKAKLQTVVVWCARESDNTMLSVLFIAVSMGCMVLHLGVYLVIVTGRYSHYVQQFDT